MKKIIIFSRYGISISDFEVYSFVDEIINLTDEDVKLDMDSPEFKKYIWNFFKNINDSVFVSQIRDFNILNENNIIRCVSNMLVIHEFRARIKENKISLDDYEFYTITNENKLVKHEYNNDGRKNNWCKEEEIYEDMLDRMLQ